MNVGQLLFEGQVALVTGGSRGIGRAVALELAQHGASVAVTYREQADKAREVVQLIAEMGRRALALPMDVSSEADVKRAVKTVASELGDTDVLVANAGMTRDGLLGSMTVDDWDCVQHTNLRGAFLCIREVIPAMMRRRSGSIVAVSSVAATMAGKGHANYAASKAGLEAMVKSLAVELAPRSLRINAVSPGIILTDMTNRIRAFEEENLQKMIPLKRFGLPAEVAKAVRFLASSEASYVTGAVLSVAGGLGL
jgi:3-oxoacyl-[acyl-carrier protein] reductase